MLGGVQFLARFSCLVICRYHILASNEISNVVFNDCHKADMLCTTSPWSLPDNVLLTAALLGMWVGTPGMLSSPPTGPCRKLRSALLTKRIVYVSDDFRAEHADLWVVVLECLSICPKNRWSLCLSAAEWATSKAEAGRRGHSAQAAALVWYVIQL